MIGGARKDARIKHVVIDRGEERAAGRLPWGQESVVAQGPPAGVMVAARIDEAAAGAAGPAAHDHRTAADGTIPWPRSSARREPREEILGPGQHADWPTAHRLLIESTRGAQPSVRGLPEFLSHYAQLWDLDTYPVVGRTRSGLLHAPS